MNHESPMSELPEEIEVDLSEQPSAKLFVDENGKQFLYEKGGVKYGGDYLPEPPASISIEEDDDFPSAPPEENFVL